MFICIYTHDTDVYEDGVQLYMAVTEAEREEKSLGWLDFVTYVNGIRCVITSYIGI